MPAESIGYPLPVIKNGYACLNEFEIELARKHIDPARPRAASESSRLQPAAVQAMTEQRPRPEDALEPGIVTGYDADAIRRSPATSGTLLSLTA
jgi:hypothetical protein